MYRSFPLLPLQQFQLREDRRVWLVISCFVCTCLLLFHVQVDVILAQRNRKLFMLDEENMFCVCWWFLFFFPQLTCLCSVILLISQCKCTGCLQFPLLSFWGCLVLFVVLLLEKTANFLITPLFFYIFSYTNPIGITDLIYLLLCMFLHVSWYFFVASAGSICEEIFCVHHAFLHTW